MRGVTLAVHSPYPLGNAGSHLHSTLYWMKHLQMLYITYLLTLQNVPVKIMPILYIDKDIVAFSEVQGQAVMDRFEYRSLD